MVDLNQIRANAVSIRSKLSQGTLLCAVVKANAYGLGARRVVSALNDCADFFAVATLAEAREVVPCTERPVLILGPVLGEDLKESDAVLHFSVSSAEEIEYLASALPEPLCLNLHLAFDSGMNRLGVKEAELDIVLKLIASHPNLNLYGFFTHFCDTESVFYRACKARFLQAAKAVKSIFPDVITHGCASSTYSDNAFDMVRPGLSLYGFGDLLTEPCAAMTASVLLVKDLAAGESVGYGCRYTAETQRKIAVLSCGYADGYRRELGNTYHVLISGRKCAVLGNICMDMMMVDVTDCSCRAGDCAVLFSRELPLRRMAQQCGTIEYELLCGIGARVERVYLNL